MSCLLSKQYETKWFKHACHPNLLWKVAYTFGLSEWEIFWPLLAGATLILAPPGVAGRCCRLKETRGWWKVGFCACQTSTLKCFAVIRKQKPIVVQNDVFFIGFLRMELYQSHSKWCPWISYYEFTPELNFWRLGNCQNALIMFSVGGVDSTIFWLYILWKLHSRSLYKAGQKHPPMFIWQHVQHHNLWPKKCCLRYQGKTTKKRGSNLEIFHP